MYCCVSDQFDKDPPAGTGTINADIKVIFFLYIEHITTAYMRFCTALITGDAKTCTSLVHFKVT